MYRTVLQLILVCGFATSANGADPILDAFDAELDALQRTDVRTIGQDALVASYEEFINDNDGHPKVAEAMLSLASVYGWVDPKHGLVADNAKSRAWCERAARSATKGSALWVKAHERLVNIYITNDPARTEKILEEISSTVPDNSLAMARVEKVRMDLAFRSGRPADGYARGMRILDWYRDSSRVPKANGANGDFAKMNLDQLMAQTAMEMVTRIQYADLTTPEKREKIKAVEDSCPWHAYLPSEVDSALGYLADPPPPPMFDRVVGQVTRMWWVCPMTGCVAVGWFLNLRRLRRRSIETLPTASDPSL